MNRDFKQFVDLFQKALSESLTDDEQKIFDVLLRDPAVRQLYAEMMDADYVAERLADHLQFSSERAYRVFVRRFRKRGYLRKWLVGCSVAASILVLIGIGVGLMSREKKMEGVVMPGNTIVYPGIPQALLKLANGREIEVTRTNGGEIREQDGVLIQYEEGRLFYRHSEQMKRETVYNELSVPLGGECYVVLEDGTRVWINAGSVLKYPTGFGKSMRKVDLVGEAYFEVAKDARPFVVHSELGDIWVRGTSFGVTAYPDENMLTTLVSGNVAFKQKQRDQLKLVPGEQVVAYPSGKIERKIVNTEEYVGWKNGIYVFKDRTLEEIMSNLERWYNVKVFYQSQQMKDVRFTGNVQRYETINAFMQILEGTGDVKYRINGNTVTLYQ